MKLDKIYIEEAKRIRREYLNNLKYIILQEDVLNNSKKKLEKITSDIDNNETTDIFNKDVLFQLSAIIETAVAKITPFNEKFKILDADQLKLYNAIKEKYPNITDIEIENEIVPYIDDIEL